MKILLPLVFLFSVMSFGHDFSRDQKWLNLHRYKEVNGKFESLVTNQEWFFSENGRYSPTQEAIAAIESFNERPRTHCLFPARVRYLKSLGFIKAPSGNCAKLDYLKKKLTLSQVSLIFASYHVNNPSSAFGHTLFKLIGRSQSNEYLNWGLNFSAIQTTNNPLLYGLYGLSGQFTGKFSLLPYFMKLKEYRDSENRDLWEYSLNLDKDQVTEFVEHLWEMDKAEFNYFYLTHNCSYQLLAFLDAINPKWELTYSLPYFVIPSETLKALSQTKGLVSRINFKPSPFKHLRAGHKEMSIPQKREIMSAIKSPNKEKLNTLSTKQLDFLIEYGDYLYAQNPNPQIIKAKRESQVLRSKRSEPYQKSSLKTPGPPHRIHAPAFLSIGHKRDQFDHSLARFELRASFHEYLDLDKDQAAPQWSKLVLGKIAATYNQKTQDLRLENFSLLEVEANEQSLFSPIAPSWGMKLALEDRVLTQKYDLSPLVEGFYGFNKQLDGTLIRAYIPLGLQYGKRTRQTTNRKRLSLELAAELEVIQRLGERSTIQISTGVWHNTLLASKLRGFGKGALRHHLPHQWALDINTTYRLKRLEYALNLIKYF